ncbi:MAG: flavodoxin family protein [Methanotrichaceae archaeon]|nr:flavodoxin family protein [Methanotrichaceae archaeon]
MKILGISGSPRGGQSQTLRLVKAALDGAREAGADVELVDVCKLRIEYCTACAVCFSKGECIFEDDFAKLLPKILECDGLVLSSPNYFRSITAQLKTMIDRMADVIHCQMLTGKYGCSVATAGSPAHAEVTDYLNGLLLAFGADPVGAVGCMAQPAAIDAAEKEAFSLGRDLVAAIREGRRYPQYDAEHEERRARFKMLVTMNKDLWTHEYEYYKEKGWL